VNIDLYEKIWMWSIGAVLAAFFISTAAAAIGGSIHPPSHIETIDPTRALSDPRFRTPGVSVDDRGAVHARIIGMTFAWLPNAFVVPEDTPITFQVTAIDVTHGFQIVRTNGQAMVVPGYVSQFTTRFNEPGEYLIVCNEYCGVGHHAMAAKMRVVPTSEWRPPAATVNPRGPRADD
jgi:cytochrome c oxidase subunit II